MKKKKHASQYGACDSKGEGDDEKVIQTDEILYFQVSCKPYGSKLRKPTKFFIQAFAKMTNSDSKEFTVFNVSYLKDDEFVISTSAKHFDAIKELATSQNLSFAQKEIKILGIQKPRNLNYAKPCQKGDISPFKDQTNLDDDASAGSCTGGGDEARFNAKLEDQKGTVAEMFDGRHFAQKATQIVAGKKMHIKLGSTYGNFESKSTRMDTDQKSVELHGDVNEISRDVLEMYLESEKKSGGGNLEHFDLDANPPIAVFEDPKAAKRVVEKGLHEFEDKKFHVRFPIKRQAEDKQSNYSTIEGNIVEIDGDISGLSKHVIEMYLESKKRSGGGELEEVNLEANPPFARFHDIEAAKRVVEKGLHEFEDKKFRVRFPIKRQAEDKQSNDSAFEGNIVEIHGDISGLSKHVIEMYLESKKRSGGGELEEVNLEANPPFARFHDIEAAKRVVEKGLHEFEDKKFRVQFPIKRQAEDKQSNVSLTEENIVEIHGEIEGLRQDFFEMYLESEKRSGGGELEEVNLEANPPFARFRDVAVAKRVAEKSPHVINGKEIHFKRHVKKNFHAIGRLDESQDRCKVVETRGESQARSRGSEIERMNSGLNLKENTLILCNIASNVSTDTLSLYLDRLLGSNPYSIKHNYNRSAIMVTAAKKIDWDQVMNAYERRPALDGTKLTIERVSASKQVLISNIAESVSKDHLELLIEKHVGNGSIADIDFEKGRSFAIVQFHQAEALPRLFTKTILMEEKQLSFDEYNPAFIEEKIWKIMHSEPKMICIDVDPDIQEHIMTFYKREICEYVHSEIFTKKAVSSNGDPIFQACISGNPDVSDQAELFKEFYSQFVVEKAAIDLQDKEIKVTAKEHIVTLKPGQMKGDVLIIGRKKETELFLSFLSERSKVTTEDISLPPEKLQLLISTGYFSEMEKSMSMKIEIEDDKIKATGMEQRIANLETKILLKLQNVKEKDVGVSANIIKFLEKENFYSIVKGIMHKTGVHFVLMSEKNKIRILAFSDSDLCKGQEVFKENVIESEYCLKSHETAFLKGPEGSRLIEEQIARQNLIIESKEDKIKLIGLASACQKLKSEVGAILLANPYVRKFIPLTSGKTKAVFMIFERQIDELMNKHKNALVEIKKTADGCSIEVSGFGEAVNDVLEAIECNERKILTTELVFQRPGISRITKLDAFQHMINGLERDLKIVIILKDEDKCGTLPVEEIEHEYVTTANQQRSYLICKYDTNPMLAVFQGDITSHSADVIVNPANSSLLLGGGVAGAILSKGGRIIQDECNRILKDRGNLAESDVATTAAGQLPCRRVIHAVGPQWPQTASYIGEHELKHKQKIAKETLSETMRNILEEAEKEECRVLAVPAVSSGIFGFPKSECVEILVNTTIKVLMSKKFQNLREIHFINNDQQTVQAFTDHFVRFFGKHKQFTKVSDVQDLRDAGAGYSNATQRRDHGRGKERVRSLQMKSPQKSDLVNEKENPSSNVTMDGLTMDLIIGNLAAVKADVIVNSSSQVLNLSKNPCAKGLLKAAGPNLQQECDDWIENNGNVPLYGFAATAGGKLKCKTVLHAVCGNYDGQNSEKELETLIAKLLDEAAKIGVSIAIPALGTGILNFPRDRVAKIIFDCVEAFSKKNSLRSSQLKKVFLVAFNLDQPMIKAFQDVLATRGAASDTTSDKGKIRRAPSQSFVDSGKQDFKLGDVILEIKTGDITKATSDAIVVLGDKKIDLMGAVGNAIKNAEGGAWVKSIKRKSPQKEGTTKLLKTAMLPSKYVAHVFPASNSDSDLREAIKTMFIKCDVKELASISLPAIGTGVIGKRAEESAKLILHSFVELAVKKEINHIKQLQIVLYEEKLVSAFKKQIIDITKNPAGFSKDKGILKWIKEKVKVFTSYFAPSKEENIADVADSYMPNAGSFKKFIWNLYSYEKKVQNEVLDRLTKFFDDMVVDFGLKNELFKKLPGQAFNQIRSFAEMNDVLVKLDSVAGELNLVGYKSDTMLVTNHCQQIISTTIEEALKKDKEQTVAKYVQWKEKQKDESIYNYDPFLNCQIEEYYKESKNGVEIEMEDDNGKICTYKLDFSDKEKMKIVNKDTNEEKIIMREELPSSTSSKVLPSHWDSMPKNNNGLEGKFHCVSLNKSSNEFQDISNKFCGSSGGHITTGNIIDIQRIQNPQLFRTYTAKKESMEKTAGKNSINELVVFHGTNPNSVLEINESGFNRSFAGVNGTVYGHGVYFAKDSNYSVGYARGSIGNRYMYLAKILAGKYTAGHQGLKVPPKGYDTVVDNPNSPRIHVVFYDNQCYPEYLLRF